MCSLGPPLHANATCDHGCRSVAGDASERLDAPVVGHCRAGQGRHAVARGFDERFLDRPEPIETFELFLVRTLAYPRRLVRSEVLPCEVMTFRDDANLFDVNADRAGRTHTHDGVSTRM
jgi:hypothetical protein